MIASLVVLILFALAGGLYLAGRMGVDDGVLLGNVQDREDE